MTEESGETSLTGGGEPTVWQVFVSDQLGLDQQIADRSLPTPEVTVSATDGYEIWMVGTRPEEVDWNRDHLMGVIPDYDDAHQYLFMLADAIRDAAL